MLPRYRHNRNVANRFPALDALIRDVETIAADQTDPLAVLILLMQMLIRSEVDPYLLNGALIEGIAATIMQRIPAEKRGEASLEAMRLLRDQLAVARCHLTPKQSGAGCRQMAPLPLPDACPVTLDELLGEL